MPGTWLLPGILVLVALDLAWTLLGPRGRFGVIIAILLGFLPIAGAGAWALHGQGPVLELLTTFTVLRVQTAEQLLVLAAALAAFRVEDRLARLLVVLGFLVSSLLRFAGVRALAPWLDGGRALPYVLAPVLLLYAVLLFRRLKTPVRALASLERLLAWAAPSLPARSGAMACALGLGVVFAVETIPATLAAARTTAGFDLHSAEVAQLFVLAGTLSVHAVLWRLAERFTFLRLGLGAALVVLAIELFVRPYAGLPLLLFGSTLIALVGTSFAAVLSRRVAVAISGTLVLLVGIFMIVGPGPAVVVIPAGLAILATEFEWARRLLERLRVAVAGRIPERWLARMPPDLAARLRGGTGGVAQRAEGTARPAGGGG